MNLLIEYSSFQYEHYDFLFTFQYDGVEEIILE
jgi:hypothetical protein